MTERADATCWSIAEPAPPDGQQAPNSMDQPLSPARRERRRRAAQEPGARLDGNGVEHHEWVHPASMGGCDQEIAAGRQLGLSFGLDPETEPDKRTKRANRRRKR